MKNLEGQMGQLSADLANATRTRFYGITLDNPRNETCKMMEVEKDEEEEIDHLIIEHKVLKGFKLLVKELKTLSDVLQTKLKILRIKSSMFLA